MALLSVPAALSDRWTGVAKRGRGRGRGRGGWVGTHTNNKRQHKKTTKNNKNNKTAKQQNIAPVQIGCCCGVVLWIRAACHLRRWEVPGCNRTSLSDPFWRDSRADAGGTDTGCADTQHVHSTRAACRRRNSSRRQGRHWRQRDRWEVPLGGPVGFVSRCHGTSRVRHGRAAVDSRCSVHGSLSAGEEKGSTIF